ncbi:MAG: nickel-dependent hydrogenase large subunit [Candidatus Brocadiia bacterium]
MSKSTITIDPVTRIEGHLGVHVEQEDGTVTEARCSGTLFRGLESIMGGRDPRDAPILTQRICGVCPQAHATASARALDEAYGVADQVPANGRLLRDILLGANFLQSHVLHFYHLAALDYVDVTAVQKYSGNDSDLQAVKNFLSRGNAQPFVPRYEGDYRLEPDENVAATKHYVEALDVRRNAHELLALFGGKMPHQCTVNVGGVGTEVTSDKVMRALSYVEDILEFVNTAYLPDILLAAERYPDYLKIGAGCSRFLSYGGLDSTGDPMFSSGILTPDNEFVAFDRDKIREEISSSYYAGESESNTPFDSTSVPDAEKDGAYSWLKSPRYDGKPCEVGPLARMMIGYAAGNKAVKPAVEGLLEKTGLQPVQLNSTLGRHAARALETKLMAEAMREWIMALEPGASCTLGLDVPESGRGAGLTEAPRGALSHWATIEDGELANYQCVVPTTWNGSPRDNQNVPGPIEQAIENETIKDLDNPFEVVRIIRSFDPCLACAVHLQRPKGELRLELPIK